MEPTVVYPLRWGRSWFTEDATRAALNAGLTVAILRDNGLEVRRKVKHLTLIELRPKEEVCSSHQR